MVGIIVSCEHASRQVPDSYRWIFTGHENLLSSHRGYDAGSLVFARRLAAILGAPLISGRWTRLLVDLNRSIGHRGFFSELTRNLPPLEREKIINRYYCPYRHAVESAITKIIQHNGRAVHISVHSFTPILDGESRNADIGLLYDPKRPGERNLARRWKQNLGSQLPLRVRCNYPYRGTADGFTTYLRTRFRDSVYSGIEIEINQSLVPLPRHIAAIAADTFTGSL